MRNILAFTFTDLVSFIIPAIIGLLIFTKRRKSNKITANCLLLWFFLIIGSFCEIFSNIYTTYSYRHNHLYNNDNLKTIFNYDVSGIVFFAIVMIVAIILFIQELRLRNIVR